MTHPEINLRGEFIFKTKWDADCEACREPQIFFFFISEISVYTCPGRKCRGVQVSASKLESGLIMFTIQMRNISLAQVPGLTVPGRAGRS